MLRQEDTVSFDFPETEKLSADELKWENLILSIQIEKLKEMLDQYKRRLLYIS